MLPSANHCRSSTVVAMRGVKSPTGPCSLCASSRLLQTWYRDELDSLTKSNRFPPDSLQNRQAVGPLTPSDFIAGGMVRGKGGDGPARAPELASWPPDSPSMADGAADSHRVVATEKEII